MANANRNRNRPSRVRSISLLRINTIMSWKNKIAAKEWRIANKEKIKADNKKWRENNKEYDKERIKLWRLENKEKIKEYNKKYSKENKKLIQKRMKKWNTENKLKNLLNERLRNAQKLAALLPSSNTTKIKNIYIKCKEKNKRCKRTYHVDHIIPLSKGGAHHQDNLRIIPALENYSKKDKLNLTLGGVWANNELAQLTLKLLS